VLDRQSLVNGENTLYLSTIRKKLYLTIDNDKNFAILIAKFVILVAKFVSSSLEFLLIQLFAYCRLVDIFVQSKITKN